MPADAPCTERRTVSELRLKAFPAIGLPLRVSPAIPADFRPRAFLVEDPLGIGCLFCHRIDREIIKDELDESKNRNIFLLGVLIKTF